LRVMMWAFRHNIIRNTHSLSLLKNVYLSITQIFEPQKS
jgi:hypothetical protein